ncbi:MAG: endoflagellar filament sheath protein [Spirochaetes bacterium]|nr:endoflagellar filament sheath protein [Spirochaetota bacterium]
MKREVKTLLLTILAGFLIVLVGDFNIGLIAQDAPADDIPAPAARGAEKKRLDGLVVDWMNDFEDSEDWRAMSTCPLGDTKIRKMPGKPNEVKEDGTVEDVKVELTDENGVTHKDEYVLGVKTYFADRGFDRVEVFPPNEYIVRGKAKEVRVWVLGRKFRHTLYIKLRDYRGKIHKLKVGRLDFWGWKEMSVIVPGWLPQSAKYAMMDKNLHFVSFFVESDKFEVPGTFYFYMDNFRIVTDLSEFTGDPDIKDNW